jgi:hypothetical protein
VLRKSFSHLNLYLNLLRLETCCNICNAFDSNSRYNLSLRYDNKFLSSVANGDYRKAKRVIQSIINLARPMFQWTSLGMKINLAILDIRHVDINLQLNNNAERTLYVHRISSYLKFILKNDDICCSRDVFPFDIS